MPVSRWNAPAAAGKGTMMKTSIIDETITLKVYHASLLTVNACVAHDYPGKLETMFCHVEKFLAFKLFVAKV